jgi:hypothetical protein
MIHYIKLLAKDENNIHLVLKFGVDIKFSSVKKHSTYFILNRVSKKQYIVF